jgi:endoribonuclease Dicer
MGLDSWDAQRWEDELRGKQVLFMTAQVLLNALRHAVIDFARIALLIFDEAHHATKNHPFNSIMREFYLPALQGNVDLPGHHGARMAVPRIFGMTASPVKVKSATNTSKLCKEAIDSLQRNLQAKVVVVSNSLQESVDVSVPKPDEFVLSYATFHMDRTADLLVLADEDMGELDDVVPSSLDLQGNGMSSSSVVLKTSTHVARSVSIDLGPLASEFLASQCRGTGHIFRGPAKITDKVSQLLNLLLFECRRWRSLPDVATSFRSIVFVNHRATAVALAWLINRAFNKCGDKQLNACSVLGVRNNSTDSPSVLRMTHAQQNEALRRFAGGKFGILIATNVVEEGLDVPSCGLVVMFDSILSSKSYIQSRGRARHPDSRYVAMVPKNGRVSNQTSDDLRLARYGADVLRLYVRGMSVVELASSDAATGPADIGLHLDEMIEPYLRSKTTKARVSATAAVNMLNHYCASLPVDKYYLADSSSGPTYDVVEAGPTGTMFACTVTLPLAAPVKLGSCLVPQTSRVKAKRLAALDAYRELYECGALDDHLFPKGGFARYRHAPYEMADDGLPPKRSTRRAAVKSTRSVRTCIVQQPAELRWRRNKGQTTVLVHVYEILPCSISLKAANMQILPGKNRYAIICKSPIPFSKLHAVQAPSGQALLSLIPMGSLDLSKEHDDLATRYGVALHQVSIDRTGPARDRRDSVVAFVEGNPGKVECDEVQMQPGLHMVPLVDKANDVDWESMQRFVDYDGSQWDDRTNTCVDNPTSLEYCLVQSRHDKRYVIYFTGLLDSRFTPNSPCQDFIGDREYVTFLDYYERRHGSTISNLAQPLLEAFTRQTIDSPARKKPFFLIPELCRAIPLSPWAIFFASLLPFWQTYLAILSFREGLQYLPQDVSFCEFASALQPKRSHGHAVGYDYERLEFIGDAALKVLASSALYQNRPLDHEGALTRARDGLVSNSYLCDVGISLGIYNVVALTSSAVKAKSWPWYMAAPQEVAMSISEKMLADCVESLIGLSFTRGGIESAARLLDEFGILEGMSELIGKPFVQPSRRRSGIAFDPRLSSPRLGKVEGIVGYTFRRKEVLVEALTHGSYIQSQVPSYQRLEFLGDAVIGLVIVNGFYQKHKNFEPSHLTFLKEPALSNELFGRVAAEHGLHKYLWHSSPMLENDMERVATAIANEKEGEDGCENIFVPKVLGDLVESIVGAIVVDQDMRLDGLDEIVVRLVGKSLNRFANPDTLEKHPVVALNQMVQTKYQQGPEFLFAIIKDSTSEVDERFAESLESLDCDGVLRREACDRVIDAIAVDDSNDSLDEGYSAEVESMTTNVFMRCYVLVEGTYIASGTGPCQRKAKRSAAIAALEVFSRSMVNDDVN